MTDKKNKVGRPKGINSNTVKITVRINEQLNEKLEQHSIKHNLTKAETVRKAINLLEQ